MTLIDKMPTLSKIQAAIAATAIALTLVGGMGCASKASDGECAEACDNVVAIGMSELEAKMAQDPDLKAAGDTGKELVKKQAEALLKSIKESCVSECSKKGTQKQADCLKNAKSSADFANCK